MQCKRIAVVTYWSIFNIGSFLQAYALQYVLKNMGFEPYVISWKKGDILYRGKEKIALLLKLLIHPFSIPQFLELRRLGLSTISDVPQETKLKFLEDQQKVSVLNLTESDIKNVQSDFYAFICGSDQIWNPLGFIQRDYKYLKFAPVEKRIAYAPSFGVNYIPAYNYRFVKKSLKEMGSISIREKEGAEIIKTLIGRDAPVVLDPTLLLSKVDWIKVEKRISLPNNYVVCFFLGNVSEEHKEAIERLRNGRHIICFPKVGCLNGLADVSYKSVGPLEFLHVIHYADCVFTDSFHGAALTINYERDLVVFKRSHNQKFNQFSRIENILDLTDNRHCIYNPDMTEVRHLNTDFSKLKIARIDSMHYLTNALIIKG